MGGNALKNTTTRRYEAKEYYELESEVVSDLSELFPFCKILPIKSYRNKETFGDMDILIDSKFIPQDYQEQIRKLYDCREMVKNGNCLSFSYKELQIDLIVTHPTEFYTSYNYFAYNDLGNLLGRISHSMGIKLGHDGLSYDFREGTYQFKNVILLTDWKDILSVLGLSYERYAEGFDDIEDIFEFVSSSPFFCPNIYLLENRNHTSRVRDAKRKTYMQFLDWIGEQGGVFTNHRPTPNTSTKQSWLPYLFNTIDGFKEIYDTTMVEWEESKKFKLLYNGELVSRVTGLSNKELGMFMKYVKEYFGDSLQSMILAVNPDVIEHFVMHMYKKYTGTLDVVEFDTTEFNFLK